MDNSWVDSVALDDALIQPIGGSMYPWAAWNHGEAGFVAPVDKIADFDLTLPWQQKDVVFGRGVNSNHELCYVTGSALVAILATRTTWYNSEFGRAHRWLPRRCTQPASGSCPGQGLDASQADHFDLQRRSRWGHD